MNAPGFLVWSPEGRLPTMVHPTLERALGEAERLTRFNPGQRFFVMAPVITEGEAQIAKAYSRGIAEGYARARGEVMLAEKRQEQALDKVGDLRSALTLTEVFKEKAEPFQSIVADCIQWFGGFRAAHASRDDWERPHTPDRGSLITLNEAFQRLLRSRSNTDLLDEEIPF